MPAPRVNLSPMRIGLTGGIGCGKSAAAAAFGRHGFRIVSADRLAHEALLAPGVVRALQERWGDEVLLENGLPDRKFIAARVFASPPDRLWLESVIHPVVQQAWQAAVADGSVDWVVEIPLLFEKGWEGRFDRTVCVTASRPRQIERVRERGWTEAELAARESAQMPLADKERRADQVLRNDGTLAELDAAVGKLVAQWRPPAR